MSHIYADGAEVLKALDEQGGGPQLASLGDYGVDHYALLDQLRILEKPVTNLIWNAIKMSGYLADI